MGAETDVIDLLSETVGSLSDNVGQAAFGEAEAGASRL